MVSNIVNNVVNKFKVADLVRDKISRNKAHIFTLFFHEKENMWHYSIDNYGWIFLPESNLEAL